MVALIILGVIVLLITLIMLLPVGADIGYEDGLLHASAKVGGILIQLFPKKKSDKPPKEKKPKKKKEKKPKPEGEETEEKKPKKKRKPDFTFDEIMALLRTVLKHLGRFGRKWKVDRFVLHYIAAGYDPYNVAMTYGKVNAALSAIAPACAQRFTVKDCDVWTDVDFTRDWMHLDFGLCMTIRIGQIFALVLGIGFGALKILLQRKKRQKQEAKLRQIEGGPEAEEPGTEEEKKEDLSEDNQEEERMAANG